MKSIEAKLDAEKFIRVHRSYIVNFTKVDSVENSVISIGGHKIPIGASYKNDFMLKINLL
jgi:DNA-binding LytR/AlgR family response regulator